MGLSFWASLFMGFGVKIEMITSSMARWVEASGVLSFPGDKVEPLDFWGKRRDALCFVEKLMSHPMHCSELRSFAASGLSLGGGRGLSLHDDHAVASMIAEAMSFGEVKVFRVVQRPYSPPPVQEPLPEPGPSYAPPTKYLELILVFEHDGTGLGQVALQLTGPDGVLHKATTNAQGLVRLNGVASGAYELSVELAGGATLASSAVVCGQGKLEGTRQATQDEKVAASKTKYLVEVEEHWVRDGETLECIAAQAGIKGEDLAFFNCGSRDPKKVNEFLSSKVGCTQKTADGKSFVFKSSDDPGLLYVPKKVALRGLVTSTSNVIRVRAIGFRQRHSFSA